MKPFEGQDDNPVEDVVAKYKRDRAKLTDEAGNVIPVADPNAIRKNRYAISSAGGTTRINWPPRTDKEAADERHIKRLQDTYAHSNNEKSLLYSTPSNTVVEGTPVATATTSNIDERVQAHLDDLKNGKYMLLRLESATEATESAVIKDLKSKGLEVLPVPGAGNKVMVKASDKIMTNKVAKQKIKALKELLNGFLRVRSR